MSVETWPKWLRWLLFAPAAILSPWLYLMIATWGMPRFMQDGLAWDVLSNAMWAGSFVFAGAWVSPARRAVALILGATLVALMGFTLALVLTDPYGHADPPSKIVISYLAAIGGGGYVVWHFVRATPAELGESMPTD